MQRFAVVVAALLLTACSGAEDSSVATFPSAPYAVVTSASGALRIEIRTAPDQPPTVGVSTVELRVSDAAEGNPMDALDVAVTPWMASHAHGASVTPSAANMGQGRYVVSDASFYMPGEWELRI